MKKLIVFLSLVLCAQGAYIWVQYNSERTAQTVQQNWLTLEANQIDRIQISSVDGQKITLQQQQNKWLLPDHFNYPVSANRLDALLEKLKEIKVSWPVATSETAAERFHLTGDNHERKLSFFNQEKVLETIYIGTSPGFRKVHVRKENDQNIYAVNLNAHDAPTKAVDWFDFDLLKLDQKNVTAVTIDGLQLNKENDTWQAQTLAEGESVNSEAVEQWLQEMSRLRFTSLVEAPAMPESAKHVAILVLGEQSIEFQLGQAQEGTTQILKRSDLPYYFSLDVQQASPLITVKREQVMSASKDISSVPTVSEGE